MSEFFEAAIAGAGRAGAGAFPKGQPDREEPQSSEADLEEGAQGLPRRSLRYLSRASRLARAATNRALADAGSAAILWDCLYVAAGRGPTDAATSRIIQAAARQAGTGKKMSLSAALAAYRKGRHAVQYLIAMEPAPAAWIARGAPNGLGPTHTIVTPGPGGSAQALACAVSALATGRIRAAMVVAVDTLEDELADPLERLGSDGCNPHLIEGAAAVFLMNMSDPDLPPRRSWTRLRIAEKTIGSGPRSDSPRPCRDQSRSARRTLPLLDLIRKMEDTDAEHHLLFCAGDEYDIQIEPDPGTHSRSVPVSHDVTHRVVVRGMGAVTALGPDLPALWSALLSCRSGLAPPRELDTTGCRTGLVGSIRDSLLDQAQHRLGSRNAALLERAIQEALSNGAGVLLEKVPPRRRALYAAIRRDDEEAGPDAKPCGGAGFLSMLATNLDLRGPQVMLHDACASGPAMVELALDDLRAGRVDAALIAAANADLSLETLCHYEVLKALCAGDEPDSCRPFDRRRDGFVRSEAGAALLLTAVDGDPQEAQIEIAGAGSSADGHELTAGHPQQRGLLDAIRRALADAGLEPDDIDHINAHGTGTPLGDLNEAKAFEKIFLQNSPEPGPPVTAIKGMTGHASFSSGLAETLVTALSLRKSIIPPSTADFQADPELPNLDLVRYTPRRLAMNVAMSVSSAFGGLNGVLVLRRFPLQGNTRATSRNRDPLP